MRICVIQIGHSAPNTQPNTQSASVPASQRFITALTPHLPQAQWSVVHAVTDPLPPVDAFDGYLITGGKYSVFDPYDWQDRLLDFITALADTDIPMIGICYGFQAIAHALGGTVERSPKGYGVGLMPVDLIGDKTYYIHAMHQDQVTALPRGAVLTMTSTFCPISGFEIGNQFLGLQHHPDFTCDINRRLMHARIDRMGQDRVAKGLASLDGPDDTETAVRWLAAFFQRQNADHRAPNPALNLASQPNPA